MSSIALEKSIILFHYITMKARIFFVTVLILACNLLLANPNRPLVYDINSTPYSQDQIKISWLLPNYLLKENNPNTTIILYRTTKPVFGSDSLKNVKPLAVLPFPTTTYTDTVIESIDYYYTVRLNFESQNEYLLVIPSVNTTINGCKPLPQKDKITEIQTTPQQEETPPQKKGELRELPLPYLSLIQNQNIDSVITQETESQARNLANIKANQDKIKPHIFRNEQIDGIAGEELILKDIIQDYFAKGHYKETVMLLNSFLQLNRSQEVTERSIFYLGEAYFYTGNYNQALKAFLLVQKSFPELTNQWIQQTLDMFSIPK